MYTSGSPTILGGGEGEVSYESVKALGILIGGMDNDDLIRPLEELASLQAEIKESGYSKVSEVYLNCLLYLPG